MPFSPTFAYGYGGQAAERRISNSVRTELNIGTISVPLVPPTLSTPARLAVSDDMIVSSRR
jgi:hypothetical protein